MRCFPKFYSWGGFARLHYEVIIFQSWAAATLIVAPLSLPLVDQKSSGATATGIKKVAALPLPLQHARTAGAAAALKL